MSTQSARHIPSVSRCAWNTPPPPPPTEVLPGCSHLVSMVGVTNYDLVMKRARCPLAIRSAHIEASAALRNQTCRSIFLQNISILPNFDKQPTQILQTIDSGSVLNEGRSLSVQFVPLKNGAQSWNRTSDTRIFSPLLYQLSYLGNCLGGAVYFNLAAGGVGGPPFRSERVYSMSGGRVQPNKRPACGFFQCAQGDVSRRPRTGADFPLPRSPGWHRSRSANG